MDKPSHNKLFVLKVADFDVKLHCRIKAKKLVSESDHLDVMMLRLQHG